MAEKKTTQDLIDLLADKHGLERNIAESLLNVFLAQIEEALDKEKQVKIKGLGVFKLTDIESRESIDVNTGERIEIRGHTKVSFVPDASLRDAINKPFSHFETVVLNDRVVFEEENNREESYQEEDNQEAPDPEAVDGKPEESYQKGDNQQVPALKAEDEKPEENPEEENAASPGEVTSPVASGEKGQTKKPSRDRSNKGIGISIVILLSLILLGGGFFYYKSLESVEKVALNTEDNSETAPDATTPPTAATDSLGLKDTPPAPVSPSEKNTANADQTAKSIAPTARTPVTPDSTSYKIVGTKTSYILQEGETLVRIARKFYGTKDLWPYIFMHNRQKIKNPDVVPHGTKLEIPELEKK